MTSTRLAASITAFVLLSAASAAADPAYVASTVNLRAGAGTNTEIVAKIPGGSKVEATNCSEWCEVEWQGKKGFAIATALDRSGRPPAPRSVARRAPPPGAYVEDEDDYVPVSPPVVYAPGPYYYGGPFYGPRWGYGYRGRRW
jgi:uncharacterized protein YraI